MADTAFRILAIVLFGEDEEYVAANSRRVRWAFHKADKANEEADAITNVCFLHGMRQTGRGESWASGGSACPQSPVRPPP